MRALHRLPKSRRPYIRQQSSSNKPPRGFLLPTLLIGAVAGGAYWWYQRPGSLDNLFTPLTNQSKPPVQIEPEPPATPEPTSSLVVIEPTIDPIHEESRLRQHEHEKSTKKIDDLLQPLSLQLLDLSQQVSSAVVMHDGSFESLETKIKSIYSQLQKIALEVNDLEEYSTLQRYENLGLQHAQDQIREQLDALERTTKQNLDEISRVLEKKEEISVQQMNDVVNNLLSTTVQDTLRLKIIHEEELIEINRKYREEIDAVNHAAHQKLLELNKRNEQEQENLYLEYMNHLTQMNQGLSEDYHKEASRVILQRQQKSEARALNFIEILSKEEDEAKENLEKLLQQVQDQKNEVKDVFKSHEEVLELLGLTQAYIILQSVQKNSRPFGPQLEQIQKLSSNDKLLNSFVEKISKEEAESGVKTLPQLQTDFNSLSEKFRQDLLRNSISGASESKGVVRSIYEYATQNTNPTGLVAGEDDSSIISRCHYHLERGSLSVVLKEMSKLDENASQHYGGWMKEAKAREHLDQTVTVFAAHVVQEISTLRGD